MNHPPTDTRAQVIITSDAEHGSLPLTFVRAFNDIVFGALSAVFDYARDSEERMRPQYTVEHARGGVRIELPAIETWENQYHGYEITITVPEYTSMCPRTGLPDFGTITIHYLPAKLCVELKSLKYYLLAYRNLGIFYENAVNRILDDVARACKPKWAVVKGEFTTRGGMHTMVEARYPRKK
jgi:7-cyano-7-deazaguanine reductase